MWIRESFVSSVMRSMLPSGMSDSPVDSARLRSGSLRESEVRCILRFYVGEGEDDGVVEWWGRYQSTNLSMEVVEILGGMTLL